MGIIQMAQKVKKVHPEYLLIFKVGIFCNAYGKDSYIISSKFDYAIKQSNDVSVCGFPKKALRKNCNKTGR
ncbi:MAG: hypothetical protein HFJ55_06995 [Clostridia bacterium]|nr:hypothetical protein [Clostridia bacterium]